MKKVEAIIQPHKVKEVVDALTEIGVEAVTLSEVRGHGRQRGHIETYRGKEYAVDYLPKMKLEMVVIEHDLEPVIAAICRSARTGKIGDGKIFTSTVEQAIRIRNGQINEAAL